MSACRGGSRYTIHPAKYFDASPTYGQWNKLTAADIHALYAERGFEGQNIYFYLNHPIRYVYLVGSLLGVEGKSNGKLAFITVDDGSGVLIDAKFERRAWQQNESDVEYPSNTSVDHVDITPAMGGIVELFVGGEQVKVGTILKLKCAISTYAGTRQLEPKRISIVKDTNEEVAFWAALARHNQDVLRKPWVLSQKDKDDIEKRAMEEQKRVRIKVEKDRERRKLRAEQLKKKVRHEEKRESRRRKEEEQMNAGALLGSDKVSVPWES